MKLAETKTTKIIKSTSAPSHAFTVQAGAKMFQMLSSGLYSDKIRAAIRELSTNAFDSHVDNGCPTRPFDVQLPTKLDPQFRLRDYGTGLDDVQVRGEHVCPLDCHFEA